jgi:hypothetical protein
MIVEFNSPHWTETLFLISTPDEGKALVEKGVPRGRIWSPKEIAVLKVIGTTPEARRAAIEMKAQFDARLQDVVSKDIWQHGGSR